MNDAMMISSLVPSVKFDSTHALGETFEDYRGQWLVVYFYPKDATPGCTTEGCDFRDTYPAFSKLNATVLGVSRDSLSSHERFKMKHNFPFDLISDHNEILCHLFDVIKLKSMYGKQVRGIERSTFIIDPSGILRHEWRKVNVKGHVAEVAEILSSFKKEK